MRILFVHRTFPGQFRYLANVLGKDQSHQVCFLTSTPEAGDIAGVTKISYQAAAEGKSKTHAYVGHLEKAMSFGQAAYSAAWKLKQKGWIPDVIIGHSGWGPLLFLKDLFPDTPLIGYFEWFYRSHGSTHGFDSTVPVTPDMEAEIRTKNTSIMHELCAADWGLTPMLWQRNQFPQEFHSKMTVIHDGVDTGFFSPAAEKLILPRKNLDLSGAKEIVTYVTRAMEPMRGFPQFMEAASKILKRRPHCHIVLVGSDRSEYGLPRADGKTYLQAMLEQFEFDKSRLHIVGTLSIEEYRKVLRASSAHIYLTFPYILSWSLMESLACGCAVISSNTPPVAEVIKSGENGFLVDFFSPDQIVEYVDQALEHRQAIEKIRENARITIEEKYSLKKLLPLQLNLFSAVANKDFKAASQIIGPAV